MSSACPTPVSNGMKMDAYLFLRGNAAEARDYYARVLGGTVPYTAYYKDHNCEGMEFPQEKQNWVMHTSVNFGTNSLMMCDSPDSEGEGIVGNNVTLCINFDCLDKMTKIFNELAGEGGKVKVPLAPQFWGAHYGLLQDKFGVIWGFNCEIKEDKKDDKKEEKKDESHETPSKKQKK